MRHTKNLFAASADKRKKPSASPGPRALAGYCMSTETKIGYVETKTLLEIIKENQKHIKTLLKAKANTIKEVQSAMDKNARTKTPLNNKQQRIFYEFTGLYAKEGGSLQKSLMRMEYIQYILHTENTQPFMLSLLLLQRHQNSAIKSLRRIIASGQKTLSIL